MDHEPMRRVAEFRATFDLEARSGRPGLAELRRALLTEEAAAYRAVAKELADVLYVTYGAADALGIDLPAVFVEVHRSNMIKAGPDGEVRRRPDGKVLKGPGYRPPDLERLVEPPSRS